MSFLLQPWQLFFLILAGWVNREQQRAIEYLRGRVPHREAVSAHGSG
jgi:hypothetical protein